jgi:hypothetical protein
MIAKRNTRKRVVNKAIVRGFRAIPTSEASLHLNSELSAPSRSRTQRPHLPHHRLRPPETNPPTTSKTSICTCTTEAPRPHHTWSTQSILSGTKSPWSCTKRGSSCVNLEGFGGYADATGCGVFRRRGSRGDAGRDVFVGTERYTHTHAHTHYPSSWIPASPSSWIAHFSTPRTVWRLRFRSIPFISILSVLSPISPHTARLPTSPSSPLPHESQDTQSIPHHRPRHLINLLMRVPLPIRLTCRQGITQ